MGVNCGFDIYQPLKPTDLNQEKWARFFHEVLRTYGNEDHERSHEYVARIVPIPNGTYIEFDVGEHPTIAWKCEDFSRFSDKISGEFTAAAKPYIRGVHKISNKYFDDRFHFWHELCETADHKHWGWYSWDNVPAAEQKMKGTASDAPNDRKEAGV